MADDATIKQELSELAEFRNEVYKATGELAQAASERLTFEKCPGGHYTVETGILWIPPFASLDWIPKRTKVVKPKCVCPACGSKHTQKISRK